MKKWIPILTCMLTLACEDAHIPARNPLLDNWELINISGPAVDFKSVQLTNIGFRADAAYIDTFISDFCTFSYSLRPDGNNRGTISMGLPPCQPLMNNLLQGAKTYELTSDTLRLIGSSTITMVRRTPPSCACEKNIPSYQLVDVKHTDQSPVQLDETRVIRVSDGVMISRFNVTSINFVHPFAGKYVLVDLHYWTAFFEKPTDIKWQGYLNGKLIAERTYRISSSCCDGYTLLAGDLSITL